MRDARAEVTAVRRHIVDLAATLADAADGVLAMGVDGRIVLWNRSAQALLGGRRRSDAIGRLCWDVLGGRDERGAPICGPECHVLRKVKAGKPVPRFRMRCDTVAGRRVSLDLSTLSCRTQRATGPLVVHLLGVTPADIGEQKPAPKRVAESLGGPGPLTPRELEVLGLIRDGLTTRASAERLRVSGATIRNHTQNILRKLDAHSRLEAVAAASRQRLFPSTVT